MELLKLGYQVRGTVRSLQRAEVQKAVAEAGADLGQLDLVTTDLLKDDGWEEASRLSVCLTSRLHSYSRTHNMKTI